MQSRLHGLEDLRDETGRAAAFINREIDGDVPSSAAGSRGGKKKKKERHLAGCPMQRIDDEQHVDTVAPFIRRTSRVKNHYSCDMMRGREGRGGGSWQMSLWFNSRLR